jgi:4-oxalocrotonate tautomerase
MPLLNVSVTGRADPKRSAAIAARLTELTDRHLGKDPALTAVAIRHLDQDQWFVGGEALSRRNAASFSLHIAVTEGTNTKPQMAAYIEAVFAAMTEILDAVRDESYVIVAEVPAAAWGYGGKTQEFRYIAGRLKATA